MSDIFPEEICYEILLRLPAEPLLRFRSVCKSWRRIIDNPNFPKLHIDKQQQCGSNSYLVIRNDTGKLYSLPLSSIDSFSTTSKANSIIELTNIENVIGFGVPRIQALPLPSCNGLILTTHICENKTLAIWNPLTRDSFVLPFREHSVSRHCGYTCIGFGYDSITDDFKVVSIVKFRGDNGNRMLETLVFSLKSNCWKRIVNFYDCVKPRLGAENGVFVNGALHWITSRIRDGILAECIIVFDVSTEEDRVLPYPSFVLFGQCLSDFHLDVLGGCLCLRNHCVVWIMKDYGENVWTKLVSLTQLRLMGKPIAYVKSRGEILFQHDNEFVLFDVGKKHGKKFSIEGFPVYVTSQVFPSSLFRLDRSGDGGGDGSIAFKRTLKRKRTTANDRLEVELKISNLVEEPPFSPLDYFPYHGRQ